MSLYNKKKKKTESAVACWADLEQKIITKSRGMRDVQQRKGKRTWKPHSPCARMGRCGISPSWRRLASRVQPTPPGPGVSRDFAKFGIFCIVRWEDHVVWDWVGGEELFSLELRKEKLRVPWCDFCKNCKVGKENKYKNPSTKKLLQWKRQKREWGF